MDLSCPSAEVLRRLCERLDAGPQKLRRTRVPGGGGQNTARDRDVFVLTVPDGEQRLWSPWLTVEVTPKDTGAHLFARFGPHPTVWTGFAFGYLALSVALIFSLAFAAALFITKAEPWSLTISAASLALMLVMGWISQVGQRLARGKMAALRAELLAAVQACAFKGDVLERRPSTPTLEEARAQLLGVINAPASKLRAAVNALRNSDLAGVPDKSA